MATRQSDLKLLWGRSGGRCAICRRALSFDPEHASDSLPLGEQAHIVARENDGPRGISILTTEQRDTYANLILLCPTDHTMVDRSIEDYPVERLHQLKTEHELWVQTQLGEGGTEHDLADQIYAALLDRFSECCYADQWEKWTSSAIHLEPIWASDVVGSIREFEIAIMSAVWPGTRPELERSLITLASVLREARETFLRHAELQDDGTFKGLKFYKELRVWDEKRYKQLFSEWRAWQNKSQALIFEATRAANWVADCARATINPAFFAFKGKFRLIPNSLFSDIPGDLWVPEYTATEREKIPSNLQERFANYRELFPFTLEDDD